jgi:predicted DNA-binding protein
MASTQISAFIPKALKARLDRHVRATGVTKAHVIEQALQHHLQVLEEIPLDVLVPARVVLTRASAQRVRKLLERPPAPTKAMKRLFDDR